MNLLIAVTLIYFTFFNQCFAFYKTDDIDIHSGLINVTDDAAMFYYYVPQSSKKANSNTLTLFLNGGPGASSEFSAYTETGPFQYNKHTKSADENPYSWHYYSSMLYIDQPFGTGYSYTNDDTLYPKTLDEVTKYLIIVLDKFFLLYPECTSKSFYLSGESFAGHYIPPLAKFIHTNRSNYNLKGIILGDPWIDPLTQVPSYPQFAYNLGLIDEYQQEMILNYQSNFTQAIDNKNWSQALQYSSLIQNMTLNYAHPVDIDDVTKSSMIDYIELLISLGNYLNQNETKKALNVNENIKWYDICETCGDYLLETTVQSTLKDIEFLLSLNLNVTIYVGNNDLNCNLIGIRNLINKIQWKYQQEFYYSAQKVWKYDDLKAVGYIKHFHNLNLFIIKNAGHELPYFVPKIAQHMFYKIISEQI